MSALLRAEVLKLRTAPTLLSLLAAMLGLSLLVVTLHALGLSSAKVGTHSSQLLVLGEGGIVVGVIFAGLLGAMSLTGEVRHGTIRPTFLTTPQRARVLAAKATVSLGTGLALGVVVCAVAAAVGTALISRRVPIALDGGDYLRLLGGGAAASALWAVIGLGLGAIVRNQVAAVVAIVVWLLFIENVLTDSLPDVSRFMPGALGQAIAAPRTGTLDSPALAALLLAGYAIVAAFVGARVTMRRDVA